MSIRAGIHAFYLCKAERVKKMHTKRTIALIGTGSLAKALATALARGNNCILLFSSMFEKAKLTAAFIKQKIELADIEAVPCSFNASWEADIIITAIPSSELKQLAEYVQEVAVQKLFIISKDSKEADIIPDDINEVQTLLPYTNIIHASFCFDKDEISYSITGNNAEALDDVHALLQEAGIRTQLNIHQTQ
jgi:8-hydroxy-5-deazaflavin:NADPH oxidoreductase